MEEEVGGEAREKWDIPAEHLREADLIRWRDLSSGARLVYFPSAFGFPMQHHLSLAARRGAELIWWNNNGYINNISPDGGVGCVSELNSEVERSNTQIH